MADKANWINRIANRFSRTDRYTDQLSGTDAAIGRETTGWLWSAATADYEQEPPDLRATDDAALTEDVDEPLALTAEEIDAYNQHGTYAGQETTADFHSPARAERLTVELADAWEFTDSAERDEYFVGDLAAQLATLIGPDRTPADSAMARQILDVVAKSERLGYRGQGEDRTRQPQLAELTGMTEFVLRAGDNLTDDQRAEALRIALDGHDLPVGAPVRMIGEDNEFGTLTGAGSTNGYPTVNVRIDGRDASIGFSIERTVRAWSREPNTPTAATDDTDDRRADHTIEQEDAELDHDSASHTAAPYDRPDVDAAMRRLTHDASEGTVSSDDDQVPSDEARAAAVRFGRADRHQLMIEEPTDQDQDDHEVLGDLTDGRSAHWPEFVDHDNAVAESEETERLQHERTTAADDGDADNPSPDAADNAATDNGSGLAPGPEEQHQQEDQTDLRAQIETSACTAAIQRAEVTVNDVRQAAAADDAARGEDLARWHADDTAARVEAEHAMKDAAADLSSPLSDD